MSKLTDSFAAYSRGAQEMDGRSFTKLLKDSKVIDKKFTVVDADLMFAKVKTKGTRKINFDQFREALTLIAEKKHMGYEDLSKQIAGEGHEGPILYGTRADDVRFHDDKSTYTGVHKMGGPSTVDGGRTKFDDLSQMCDRSDYDIRGVKKTVMANRV